MRILINSFTITHILLIVAWLFPVTGSLSAIRNVFSRYIVFLGLDQNYSMFAPRVRKVDRHFIALITFQDLSTVIWPYPRVERMSIIEAMYRERYRKFANDNLVMPSLKMFLPGLARFIARTHVCPGNKPELVSIYMSETNIPGPRWQAGAMPASSALLHSCSLTNIFSYQVEDKDLD
jgi:hypothetical protein